MVVRGDDSLPADERTSPRRALLAHAERLREARASDTARGTSETERSESNEEAGEA